MTHSIAAAQLALDVDLEVERAAIVEASTGACRTPGGARRLASAYYRSYRESDRTSGADWVRYIKFDALASAYGA